MLCLLLFCTHSVYVTDGEYEMKAETEAAEGEDVPKVMVRSGTGVYKLDDNEYEETARQR